jgi:NAD(P)-dependent dehydrogenase (short-subunit alcohol dehydrogenase family)
MNISTKPLTGKVALVTGGSRSIGAAIVKKLAADGAAVALTYSSSSKKADELVRSVESDGGRALAIRADNADVPPVKQHTIQDVVKRSKSEGASCYSVKIFALMIAANSNRLNLDVGKPTKLGLSKLLTIQCPVARSVNPVQYIQ